MSDYIKREDTIKAFYTATGDGDKAEWCVGVIQSIPTADVVGVRHGRWERVDYGNGLYNYHCSSCRYIPRENIRSNYCPNCGADMKEES